MIEIDVLIKESFKGRKFVELRVYRNLKTMITNFKTQKNAPEYTEAAEVSLIRKYLQQAEEAMTQYKEAGRPNLVKECMDEIGVLKTLLPKEIEPQDVLSILAGWCARNSFINTDNNPEIPKKNMGLAIKAMKEVFPTADGKMISELVKQYVV